MSLIIFAPTIPAAIKSSTRDFVISLATLPDAFNLAPDLFKRAIKMWFIMSVHQCVVVWSVLIKRANWGKRAVSRPGTHLHVAKSDHLEEAYHDRCR